MPLGWGYKSQCGAHSVSSTCPAPWHSNAAVQTWTQSTDSNQASSAHSQGTRPSLPQGKAAAAGMCTIAKRPVLQLQACRCPP